MLTAPALLPGYFYGGGMVEYSNSQISAIIDEYIHDALHRRILKMRFVDHTVYDEIAEAVERDVSTVKRIVRKNEWAVFKHLK